MAYNCDAALEDPICDPCGDEIELGRVRASGFMDKTAYDAIAVDPTDETVWEAQVAAGTVKVLPMVRGSFDGGTPVEVDGYGDQATRVIGYDYVLNFKDPVYKSNYPFYNSLKGKSAQYVFFKTETQIHISDKVVTVAPKNPVEEDSNTEVVWDVEVKWRQQNLVKPFDAPVGIFECE